jgi:chemotaxis protein CheZ
VPAQEGRNMPVQRKVFRIEQMAPVATPASLLADTAPLAQREILAELHSLRDLIERRSHDATQSNPAPDGTGELRRLMQETENIHRAINHTKQEIASVRVRAFDDDGCAHVARQLGAVADSAERATQCILDAAEDIEDVADTLAACLTREQERALAEDVHNHAARIFEACNFQDLNGQRINKVIATLQFVEERIAHMMAIWGGMEAFRNYTAAAIGRQNNLVLHGPKLAGDPGHATQDEIDALFTAK